MPLLPEQRAQFDSEGWVIVEDVFDQSDFVTLLDDFETIVDNIRHEIHEYTEADTLAKDASFEDKYKWMVCQTASMAQKSVSHKIENRWPGLNGNPFDISLPQRDIETDTRMYTGAPAFQLLRHDPLLDLVEDLIGPEITSNPVQHIQLVPPHNLVEKSPRKATEWHQDIGVVSDDADNTPMVTAWVPITDAPVDRGCLAVMPRGHQLGVWQHCVTDQHIALSSADVAEDAMEPLPMRSGSVLFMTRFTPHRALPNVSDHVRISMDLRYQPTGYPTGRKWFPAFVARSRSQPTSELHNANAWAAMWTEARNALAAGIEPKFNRWDRTGIGCA